MEEPHIPVEVVGKSDGNEVLVHIAEHNVVQVHSVVLVGSEQPEVGMVLDKEPRKLVPEVGKVPHKLAHKRELVHIQVHKLVLVHKQAHMGLDMEPGKQVALDSKRVVAVGMQGGKSECEPAVGTDCKQVDNGLFCKAGQTSQRLRYC